MIIKYECDVVKYLSSSNANIFFYYFGALRVTLLRMSVIFIDAPFLTS